MEYNEYKAPAGKVLFNLDDFTYGHTILSVHNLNLVIMNEDKAKQLAEEYQEAQDKIHEEARIAAEANATEEAKLEQTPVMAKSRSRLNLAAEDVEEVQLIDEDGNVEEDTSNPDNSNTNDAYAQIQDKINSYKCNAIANLLVDGIKLNDTNIVHNIKTTTHI